MAEIQDKRAKVVLPNGRKLHAYANLYINARNTMMYKRRDYHRDLCVVRINTSILEHPPVIVADQNACSAYVRFDGGSDGLSRIQKQVVFAKSWIHDPDQIATWRHKAAMCAEALLLDCVPATYIKGVYVSCEETEAKVRASHPGLDVTVNSQLFFR